MLQRMTKCLNFGLCSKADSRELVPLTDDGVCTRPECKNPLREITAGDAWRNVDARKVAALAGLGTRNKRNTGLQRKFQLLNGGPSRVKIIQLNQGSQLTLRAAR
jgi:hypothetical protein